MTDFVDAETTQLIVTNLVLGLACAILLAIVVIGIAVQLIGRRSGSPADDSPPMPGEPQGSERTLSEERSELPDGWPPLPDARPKACSAMRY